MEGPKPIVRRPVVVGDPAGQGDLDGDRAVARGRVVPPLHLDVDPVACGGHPTRELDPAGEGSPRRHRDMPFPVVVAQRLADTTVGEEV